MHRSLNQSLIEWKSSPSRQPLLLGGARQTGKTYLVEAFAESHYERLVKINFEKEPHYLDCFKTLDAKRIVQEVELLSGQSIVPGKTLLFLDEIQECPNAIQALRYFYEDMPELHVIGAGSLLEFVLTDKALSMPVGRVAYLYLYPMTFSEMLYALGQDKLVEFLNNVMPGDSISSGIHQRLLEQLQLYFVLGGMPQVIQHYTQQQALLTARQTQSSWLCSLRMSVQSCFIGSVMQKDVRQKSIMLPPLMASWFLLK